MLWLPCEPPRRSATVATPGVARAGRRRARQAHAARVAGCAPALPRRRPRCRWARLPLRRHGRAHRIWVGTSLERRSGGAADGPRRLRSRSHARRGLTELRELSRRSSSVRRRARRAGPGATGATRSHRLEPRVAARSARPPLPTRRRWPTPRPRRSRRCPQARARPRRSPRRPPAVACAIRRFSRGKSRTRRHGRTRCDAAG